MGGRGGCTSPLCVDLTEAALSHAQVAGVLAGFAMAAIAVVLARSPVQKSSSTPVAQRHDGIAPLFVALFALVVAAYLYGTAAGEESGAQRAAAMTFAAGLAAAIAISNLAFALVGLLAASAHRELALGGGRAVALAVPTAGSLYVFVSAVDVLRADDSDEASETWVEVLLTVMAAVILIGGAWVLFRIVWKKGEATSGRLSHLGQPTTEGTLVVASGTFLCAALVYFLVLLYVPGSASAVWVVPVMVAAWVLFIVILFNAVVTTLEAL
jgi:hypothetical protein